MLFDYETLRIIWWVLLGTLLAGFAIFDGFDFGLAMLLLGVARTDDERRILRNIVGPVWESNQVWFILAGGAIFAAWPLLYAVSFSGFYIAMFVVLTAFIIRPVAFKYRSKSDSHRWRHTWDYLLCISGVIPSLVFGVAIGNVIQGVPFYFDPSLRAFYTGSFWALFNPFSIFCGVVSVLMLLQHGAAYIVTKTDNHIEVRARKVIQYVSPLLVLLFILGGIWVANAIPGYVVTSPIYPYGPSNPFYKTVQIQLGAWMNNYQLYPWMMIAPTFGVIGASLAWVANFKCRSGKSTFFFSACSIAGIIATVGFSLFPFLLPSSSIPSASLTVWDASSSPLTLSIMLIATLIFLPIILAYVAWVYRVMRGKITAQTIKQDGHDFY